MRNLTTMLPRGLLAALPGALLAVLLAGAPAGALAADEADPTPGPTPGAVPMAFAEQFSDDHLSGMLSRIGHRTEALRALAEFDGTTVATVFDAQIDLAVSEYGERWARNMALAWDPLLSDDEMRSLLDDAAGSPFADKYVASRATAAASMAELSSELFAEILTEVVSSTLERLSQGDVQDAAPPAEAGSDAGTQAPAK